MVKIVAAVRRVEDSTRVLREEGLVGFNRDGDDSLGDSGLHLVGGELGNLEEASGLNASLLVLVVFAGTNGSGVAVGVLPNGEVALQVLEGIVHVAAFTTVVWILAVDELLLGKLDELASLFGVCGLDRGHGGEGPARSALLLVLDGVNHVVHPPVDKVVGDFSEVADLTKHFVVTAKETTVLSLLFLSHGGELVVSESEGGTRLVVELDEGIHLLEDVLPHGVLLDSSELEAHAHGVVHELGVDVGIVGGGGGGAESGDGSLHLVVFV